MNDDVALTARETASDCLERLYQIERLVRGRTADWRSWRSDCSIASTCIARHVEMPRPTLGQLSGRELWQIARRLLKEIGIATVWLVGIFVLGLFDSRTDAPPSAVVTFLLFTVMGVVVGTFALVGLLQRVAIASATYSAWLSDRNVMGRLAVAVALAGLAWMVFLHPAIGWSVVFVLTCALDGLANEFSAVVDARFAPAAQLFAQAVESAYVCPAAEPPSAAVPDGGAPPAGCHYIRHAARRSAPSP